MKPFYDFRIIHKTGWIAASGLRDIERATTWLRQFNPQMYDDKTLTLEEFLIQGNRGNGWETL